MDVTAEMLAGCEAAQLFRWVQDLGHYPQWLDIVPRAVPAEPHPSDMGPAWTVDLRGQVGPFSRVKRLRMVRTVDQPPERVRFERVEHDGRDHSAWVLTAEVTVPADAPLGSSLLTMNLHYGGFLGGPVVEKMLLEEIERSRPRLYELTASGTPPHAQPG
jgi:polyketide cyclase/dehydrase/lipid transport protein